MSLTEDVAPYGGLFGFGITSLRDVSLTEDVAPYGGLFGFGITSLRDVSLHRRRRP